MVFGSVHGRAQFGGGFLAATSPQFTAQPGVGFEQRGFVQPGGQGIVRREPPGLARQSREDILGDLLGRAGVLDLAQRRGEDQVEMPPHHVREGRLLAVAREALEQLKILTPFVHLYP